MKEHGIDALFAQETWMRKCDGALIKQIEEYGYNFSSYRRARKLDWGGGVGVIYKKDLKLKAQKRNHNFKSFEHLCCKVSTTQGCILYINVYRPDYSAKNKFTVKMFLEEFTVLLQELSCQSVPCVVIGDLNLHLELATDDSILSSIYEETKRKNAKDFYSIVQDFGFTQLVSAPTHILNGTLDLIIVQNVSLINKFTIGLKDEICSSDHFPLHINLNDKPLLESKKVTIQRRYLNCMDNIMFVEELRKTGVESKISSSKDPNEAIESLTSCVSTVLEKLCPIESKTVKHRPKQKWFTPELRELKRTRRQMERKYLKHPSVKNYNEYVEIQRIFNSASNSARSSGYSEVIRSNKNDMKKLYRTVNELLGDGIVRTLPSHTDERKLADEMGSCFNNKIEKIRSELSSKKSQNTFQFPVINHQDIPTLDHFNHVTDENVTKVISSMKNKENLYDPVPITVVKQNLSFFLPLLNKANNLSLSQGVFADDLKHALVSPIYKVASGDSELNSNYRPVSNLPFISKIHEKLALIQIQEHLDKNNLNPEFQSAYQSGHSCETAVCRVVNDMQKMVAGGQMVILAQLDMSAAFDTVDHTTLLDFLCQKFGITGKVLAWLKSYLYGRTFAVKIQYVRGGKVLLIYGVPQGSILGPLLFILYINDIPRIAAEFDVCSHGYADDAQLYMPFDPFFNYTAVSTKLKNCIFKIEQWMNKNYLKLNVDKTEVMFIGKKRDHDIHQLQISFDDEDEYESSSSDSVKFLGTHIDATLSMKKMISRVCKIV